MIYVRCELHSGLTYNARYIFIFNSWYIQWDCIDLLTHYRGRLSSEQVLKTNKTLNRNQSTSFPNIPGRKVIN